MSDHPVRMVFVCRWYQCVTKLMLPVSVMVVGSAFSFGFFACLRMSLRGFELYVGSMVLGVKPLSICAFDNALMAFFATASLWQLMVMVP